MALKVKAVERLLKFDKEKAGKYRYVMKAEMYSSLNQTKVIKEAALRSKAVENVNEVKAGLITSRRFRNYFRNAQYNIILSVIINKKGFESIYNYRII